MKYRAGQKVTITNEIRDCVPYNKHNGETVKIISKNTFLGLYTIKLGNQEWAVHEEGLKVVK